MKNLIVGVHAFSAVSQRQRDIRLRDLGKKYSHLAYEKHPQGGWVIYAGNQAGAMRWQGVKNSLSMTANSIFLEATETGIYGFALSAGGLSDEWTSSTTMDFQTISHYLMSFSAQIEKLGEVSDGDANRPRLYLSNITDIDESFPIDATLIASLKPVHVTLVQKKLIRGARLQLKPVADLRKGGSQWTDVAVLVGTLGMLIGGFAWYWQTHIREDVGQQTQRVNVDPYEGLKNTLTSTGINVKARLVQLVINLKSLRGLNGWRTDGVELKGNTTMFSLERSWGNWDSLKDQVKNQNFMITAIAGKYQLSQNVMTNAVMSEPVGIKPADTIRYLNDALAYYWPGKVSIEEKAPVTNGAWKQVTIVINMRGVYPEDLDNVGSVINGWPVTFDHFKASISEDGLLTGELTLAVVGITEQRAA